MGLAIYFFTSTSPAGRKGFELASAAHAEHDWAMFVIESKEEKRAFEAQEHNPDVIISFLNPYIIPPALLACVGTRAFNVHPATPDNPGRDPQHFAFYEGSALVGATVHRMETSIDSGEIVDVLEETQDRRLGVMRFVERSEQLSIDLLLKHLPGMLVEPGPPANGRRWRMAAKRTRKDFLDMCAIDSRMDEREVVRRIEAFYHPDYESVYVEIHGHRFVYRPTAEE